jgi:hypothetical protein
MKHIIADLGANRVETEAIQFNNDWKGLFIRGDDCIELLTIINAYLEKGGNAWYYKPFLQKLKEEIESVVLK